MRMSFLKDFLDYYNSGMFSDVTVIRGDGKQYHVHRLILALGSEYFHRLFLEHSSEKTIKIEFADPNEVFSDALQYMYSGEVIVTDHNSIPLLALADKLEMSDLKTQTSRYIASRIRRENCIEMLERAFEFDAKEVITKCTNVIARHFCFLHVDFSFLPPEIYLQILQHEDLAVKNEVDLLQGLESYIREKKEISPAIVTEMVRSIRFIHFTMEQMNKYVIGNPLIPPEIVIEALAQKVTKLVQPGCLELQQPLSPRHRERKRYGLMLEYVERKNGVGPNGNGVLAWIATNGGGSQWTNPAINGDVKITASSVDKGDPSQLLAPEPSELWTADVPASWICIDLGEERSMVPTHYTLRHGGNYKGDSLRHWDLQGSVDGKCWFLIKRHSNDTSLNMPFAVQSWWIGDDVSPNKEWRDMKYRFFRILQTGHNSSNHIFLMLSGFEIYGELFET